MEHLSTNFQKENFFVPCFNLKKYTLMSMIKI